MSEDYKNTDEYHMYIETLTPYQKYLFDNDETVYISDPKVYFSQIYTKEEGKYFSTYGVYHNILNDINDYFCVLPFSKNPSDFRFIKSEFQYFENLYGTSYKPDLSKLVRDEKLLKKSKLFSDVKNLMLNSSWDDLKTILKTNLNLVDKYFINIYFAQFWYEMEDMTPLIIAHELGFDINNKTDEDSKIYIPGTLLSWVFQNCVDFDRYQICMTKTEKYIIELIQYCFEIGAKHPKYTMYNYHSLINNMNETAIKKLFINYENQIESQFDFTKYNLLTLEQKEKVKNLLLISRVNKCLRPSIILEMFSVLNLVPK